MSKSGLYKLNGLDIYSSYGFVPDKSNPGKLLPFPKSKAVPQYNWPDEDGTEYDLTVRYFENTTFTLAGEFQAATESDFWTKYNNLWNVLKTPGEHYLYSATQNKTYAVFYLEMPKADLLIPFSRGGIVHVKAEITFQIISVVTDGSEPIYYGAVASPADDSDSVKALPNTFLTSTGNSFNLETGTTYRIFQFWIPAGKTLVGVTDQTALGFPVTYTSQDLSIINDDDETIDGVLWTLTNAIAYSTNHIHKVTIA